MGAAGNLNYTQVLDFMLGFVGIDIARDDGRHLGLWPWESDDRRASRVAEWLHGSVFGEASRPRPARLAQQSKARPPEATASRPEPSPPPAPRPRRASAKVRSRPETPRPRPKVAFCERCLGRLYLPAALAAAGDGSPFDQLSAQDKAWPGRWCECWRTASSK